MQKKKSPALKHSYTKSSFRDPSGFIFKTKNKIYRQVNKSYKNDFNQLIKSGLYENLTSQKLLIRHQEESLKSRQNDEAYKIIKPEKIDFITYPYEWSFNQYKDAALITLKIEKIALKYRMTLKDASAYNIQFYNGNPILIDTLSFETYKKGSPWVAYKQFCEHFLGPLALMAYYNPELSKLLITNIDGIKLELVSKLLPIKARLNPGLFTHINLHNLSKNKYEHKQVDRSKFNKKISKPQLLSIIKSLERTTRSLKPKDKQTQWENYYDFTNYSEKAFEQKNKIIKRWIKKINPKTVCDLGSNTGVFSRISTNMGIKTISIDNDYNAVDKNYMHSLSTSDQNMMPLVADITNPSPNIGWENQERLSLISRIDVDLVMSLALVHHLRISNNTPLPNIFEFFSGLGRWLIVEFVPLKDTQVKRLLANRKSIYNDYTQENFENELGKYYEISSKSALAGSKRVLYLLKKRG